MEDDGTSRVGSPGIRFQVRAMDQAPWHYYVDTFTGKAYSQFPSSTRAQELEMKSIPMFKEKTLAENDPPLVGCQDYASRS
mmetsp:Transcript_10170/g.31116  ORF Transcript_10170/g.31116 Transcript_10170/m.31116 type:complete len:81 (-) Transcript_10170:233-475(-)